MLLQQLDLLRANLLALGARRLLALGVVVLAVMAAVGAIAMYASRPETEALYVGLTPADVGRIGAALREAGIPFDVSADGAKVLVRRAQAPNARMLLAEKGLPAGGTSGYELFDKLGPLGLTSFMQEVTRTRALEGELARTIQSIKGVKSARVHVVVPEPGSFRRRTQAATASVVLRLEGPSESNAAQIIRHLVSAAVPGLAAEQVSVLSTDGSVLAVGGDIAALGSTKMIELERTLSRQLQDNIRRTLAPYLGVENFEVSVATRLNLDKRQVNEQVFDPESKSERSTRVVKEAGNQQSAGPRPTVSVEQNIPTEASGGAGGESSRKSNERREELTNFELNSKTISTMSEGHRVEALTVAVVINRKRLSGSGGSDAAKGDKATVDAQLKEIENLVASAAGLDIKRGDKISIAAVDFLDHPAEAASRPGMLASLLVHLDTAIIAITAIAVMAIFVWFGLMPAIRAILAKPAEPRVLAGGPLGTEGDLAIAKADQVAQITAGDSGAGAAITGPIGNALQVRLAELVERDEKQVAEVLKQWLARAA